MAYYNVNSAATNIAPIATALQGVPGLITSVKYQDLTNFIFTTPYSNKHVHFVYSTSYGKVSTVNLGDGWTSGASVTNAVQYQTLIGDTAVTQKGQFIVTPDVFCYISRSESTTLPHVTLFCKNDSGDFLCLNFIGGSATNNGVASVKCANTTQGYDLQLLHFGNQASVPGTSSKTRTMYDSTGKFYKMDVLLKNITAYAGKVVGLKVITRDFTNYNPTFGYEVKGNDVIVPGGCYRASNEDFPYCFLIENGAI